MTGAQASRLLLLSERDVNAASATNFFYLDADCVCETARQFRALVVGGDYGFKSPEYKAVNTLPFRKPKL